MRQIVNFGLFLVVLKAKKLGFISKRIIFAKKIRLSMRLRHPLHPLAIWASILLLTMLPLPAKPKAGGPDADLLLRQCEQERSLSKYGSVGRHADQLLKMAGGNERLKAYGLFYKGLSMLFTGHSEEAKQLLIESHDIAFRIDNDSISALAMNAKGIYHIMVDNNNFLAQQMFFRSLEHAEDAGYESLKMRVLGNLLLLTQSRKDTTAMRNAKDIYDYGKQKKDYELWSLGTYYLALLCNSQGDNNQAEHYLKEALDLYHQHNYEDVASVYTLYSKVESDKGNLNKAEEHAREAIRLSKLYDQPFLQPDAYLQCAKVLHLKGDYVGSNEMAKSALEKAMVVGRNKTVECHELMAANYRKLGNNNLAMDCIEKANLSRDTLEKINMDRLFHERKIMLLIQKKEREELARKQQMGYHKIINTIIALTTVALVAMLCVIAANYRRRNQLYKNIVQQNAKGVARQDELQHQIDKLTQLINEQGQQQPTAVNEQLAQDLYEQACQLMERERLYTDPKLNRDKMAELLNTNRTYLSNIIKEKSGMSYLQFVNSYRINEAVRILSDHDKIDYPLKQIWSDLGFNSPTTFYKLFQQAVGITPSVYRKQFIDLERNQKDTQNEKDS